jgi:hypothetical protein
MPLRRFHSKSSEEKLDVTGFWHPLGIGAAAGTFLGGLEGADLPLVPATKLDVGAVSRFLCCLRLHVGSTDRDLPRWDTIVLI